MKVTQTRNSDGTIVLQALASKAEVEDALNKAQLSFAQQMNLEVQDASSIAEQAERELGIKDLDLIVEALAIEYLGPFVLEKNNITPLYPPDKPKHKASMRRGSEFSFEVTVTPKPLLELTSYDPVRVTVEPFEVDPKEVDQELLKIADSYARFTLDKPRSVKNDDYCLIDLKASQNGNPIESLTNEGLTYVMNAGYMPPIFDENIVGMNVGETKTFSVELPSHELSEDKEEQNLDCTVTVKGIQKRDLPELTDEWVQNNLAPYTSLDELKNETRQRLLQENKNQYDIYLRQAATSELSKRFKSKIPDEAYKAMQETMINKMRVELSQQGMSLEQHIDQNGGQQQFQMMLMLEIRENLIQGYALDALFRHENLALTDADIDLACAALNPQSPQVVREQMMQSGRGFALREMAERMKASRWLVDHAIIETAPAA